MTVELQKSTINSIAGSTEAAYAKKLAGNDKQTRDRAFKKLRQYLTLKSENADGGLKRDEMLRLWKGLFYCMWMSDKPLVQEELASKMANILSKLNNIKTSMLYFETFLSTMSREWRGIDRLRMDKFYMLTRLMLQQAFALLKKNEWDKGVVDWLISILRNGPLSYLTIRPGSSAGSPLGMRLHFIDIYVDELTKSGHDSLQAEQVTAFLLPYCVVASNTQVDDLRDKVLEKIFQEIIDQSDAVLNAVAESEEDAEIPKDRLQFDYKAIADCLFEQVNKEEATARNRTHVYAIVKNLRDVAEGSLPFQDIPDIENEDMYDRNDMKKAEDALTEKLCAEMESDSRKRKNELKQYRKECKKRKLTDDEPFQDENLMQNDSDGMGHDEEEEETAEDDELLSKLLKIKKNNRKKKKKKVLIVPQTTSTHQSKNSSEVTVKMKAKRKKKSVTSNASSSNDSKKDKDDKKFADFTSTKIPSAAFFRVAASKANMTTQPAKSTPSPKSKKEKPKSTPSKRVSFEMSKVQIQAFRKNDRSSVLSPSTAIPFDPNRTPDFGLLKSKKAKQQKANGIPKRKRPRVSDLFV